MTRDGHLVCVHGNSLNKHVIVDEVFNGGRVLDYTLADIQQMRLLRGGSIPSLKEVFALVSNYPNSLINLDLRGPFLAAAVAGELQKAASSGVTAQTKILLSGFDFSLMKDVRVLNPSVDVSITFNTAIQRMHPTLENIPVVSDFLRNAMALFGNKYLERQIISRMEILKRDM